MSAELRDRVGAALRSVRLPDGRSSIVDAAMVSEIVIADRKAFFSLTVPAPDAERFEPVRAQAEAAALSVDGIDAAMVVLTAERRRDDHAAGPGVASRPPAGASAPRPPSARPGIPGIARIIAVASGKGGVGKSTTAVNLALGLRALGLSVGLLDADIYGPSIPRLLAIRDEKPKTAGGRTILPIEAFGLRVMSMGLLVEEETAMIWRGPMVMSALTQMLREVEWGALDILVVDMPPGTGDAQLTLAQQVPLAGAVIVSTPQDLSLIDARRGLAMFRKVEVPVLGIVENMSYFVAPDTGRRYDIFGHGGARAEAERLGVRFLGEVPLEMTIRETSDAGRPVVATDPDGPHAAVYRAMAAAVLSELEGTGSTAVKAPKIVFE